MSDFFSAFNKITKADWQAKLMDDLKGKNPSLLEINDVIEEINLSTYQHLEDALHTNSVPGNFPFLRGMNTPDNQWKNGCLVTIQNEKNANKKALEALNSGADLLVFKSVGKETNWTSVLENIKLEYVEVQFVVKSKAEFDRIQAIVPNNLNNIQYNLDFLEEFWDEHQFNLIAESFKTKQQAFCSINGFKIQQTGATTWQENAFCLSTGHEYLVKLMKQGFTIDEAAACITFKIGIGSNYFYEIAKIRSLKMLWSKIIHSYQPAHKCSYNCNITAISGHMNKSLKDPYTNLLRQTTEVMSAANGGVNGVVTLPYDSISLNGASSLAERLALNISSILKEESYIDKVNDPLGGSYSIEKLTDIIGKKSWKLFQELDSLGGTFKTTALDYIRQSVNEKRTLRIEKYKLGETVGIGINKYPNTESFNNQWNEALQYLGMTQLILENEYKTATE